MTLVDQIVGEEMPPKSTVGKRVLIYGINYAPEPIGVGRYTSEIGTYLAGHGAAVEVITAVPHYPGWLVRGEYRNRYTCEEIDSIRINRCPLLLRRHGHGIWRLLAPLSFALSSAPVALWRILKTRPDVVLCVEPTLLSAPVALWAARLIGARTVLHVQDLEVDAAFAVRHLTGSLFMKLALAFEKLVLRRFDSIITISNRMRDRLARKGACRARIAFVRNWVNLEKIKPLADVSGYRTELGIPTGKFIALYAGNVGVKQALPMVFEAAAKLAQDPTILFVIAGDGPQKRPLIDRYGHLPNVRFLPIQPEDRLCELLSLADVHLLPQDAGTADLVLPSKLGGMLASGKPCIVMAGRGTELHEFLENDAIIVSPGDSAALAEALRLSQINPAHKVHKKREALVAEFDARLNLAAFAELLA